MRLSRLFFALVLIAITGYALSHTLAAAPERSDPMNAKMIERGKYLVLICDCNVCHTPKKMGPKGPEPDMTLELSGHPAEAKLPEMPKGVVGPGNWDGLMAGGFTAWAGPWGVSFPKNLTPDVETGLGSWTEEMFIKAIRTGKHMGAEDGRDILPPMPWPAYRNMTDEDLKAVWAYLRSIKPIKNAVPEPLPPQMEGGK